MKIQFLGPLSESVPVRPVKTPGICTFMRHLKLEACAPGTQVYPAVPSQAEKNLEAGRVPAP